MISAATPFEACGLVVFTGTRQSSEVRTDLLYAVKCNGREAFVHVLFEHLSSNNDGRLAPFRLLRYCVRIWESFLKDHPGAAELPAIIPIVLHHSNTGWSGPTALSEIIDLDAPSRAALSGLGPELRFLLDDCAFRPAGVCFPRR